MKKIFFASFFLIGILIFAPNTQAASKQQAGTFSPVSVSPHIDSYGAQVIWFDEGENGIKYKNIDTGVSRTIDGVNNFSGFGVLSEMVYWIDGDNLYKYNVGNQTKQSILNMRNIEGLESTAQSFWLEEMVNNNFFEYQVTSESGSVYTKQYDLTNGVAYGISNKSGSALVGDNYELFKDSSDSVSESYYKLAYLNTLTALIGHPTQFGSSYDEFRTKVLPLGTITKVKENVDFTGMFRDGKYNGERAVFWKNQEGNTALYKFNVNSGTQGSKIQDLTDSSVNLTWTGSNALWYDVKTNANYYYYYRADLDQTCYVDQDDSIKENVYNYDLSNGYVFWSTKDGKIYSKKLVCAQEPSETGNVATGELIKSNISPAVYYKGDDGKRYVFFNADLFYTWYSNFNSVKTISASEMTNIEIGGNATYRPGSLVKITSSPKVYAVDKGGVLRWVSNESVMNSIYGSNWSSQVRDIPDFLFVNYKMGSAINSSSDFNPTTVKNNSPDINTDKGL